MLTEILVGEVEVVLVVAIKLSARIGDSGRFGYCGSKSDYSNVYRWER